MEGAVHEVKGKAKETAGQVLNNPDLEAEGKAENLVGKLQSKIGQIEKVFDK
ncbi:MAG: CsbD family protein [Candidatus Solibacter sp.]